MTPGKLLRAATATLTEAGVAAPENDAAELLGHAAGCDRSRVALLPEVTPECADRFLALVARRARREPLQHLTGAAWFRHVRLAVGPGVFVPRPETEVLVGWAVDQARGVQALGRTPRVVDLGTGSGAIALSVATEVPGAQVHAVEVDEGALPWAARNLAGSEVDLRSGDLADSFFDLDCCVDVVVVNPPYIPLVEYESVAPEARDHDPPTALWGGADGLDVVRAVERTASRLLVPGGVVGVEHAAAQAEAGPAIFAAANGWSEVRDHVDLVGRPRFVTARKVSR